MGVLEGCSSVLKYIFFFFTFVFWVLGLASIAIGIWALVDDTSFDKYVKLIPGLDSHALSQAATLLIVVGVLVMIIGFLGCCGAIKENQCFLGLFSILLFLIFALMVAGAVIAYGYKDVLDKIVVKGIDQLKKDYYNAKVPTAKKSLDSIQQEFKCCEFNGTKVPGSCFENANANATVAPQPTAAGNATTAPPATVGPSGKRFTRECAPQVMADLNEALDKYKYQIGGIGIASCIIILLGVVVSMALCCKIRRGYANV